MKKIITLAIGASLIVIIVIITIINKDRNELFEVIRNDYLNDVNVVKIININIAEGDSDNAYANIVYIDQENIKNTNNGILYQRINNKWQKQSNRK